MTELLRRVVAEIEQSSPDQQDAIAEAMQREIATGVRLIVIGTPETKGPKRPVQCFGAEAKAFAAFLFSLAPDGARHLERDVGPARALRPIAALRLARLLRTVRCTWSTRRSRAPAQSPSRPSRRTWRTRRRSARSKRSPASTGWGCGRRAAAPTAPIEGSAVGGRRQPQPGTATRRTPVSASYRRRRPSTAARSGSAGPSAARRRDRGRSCGSPAGTRRGRPTYVDAPPFPAEIRRSHDAWPPTVGFNRLALFIVGGSPRPDARSPWEVGLGP